MSDKFSIISLGCARNLVDSEKMTNQLVRAGYKLVSEGTDEDIVILNTCSFIKCAVEETEENLDILLARKKGGGIGSLVVTGCFPGRFAKKELIKKYPDIDFWLDTSEENNIVSMLDKLSKRKSLKKEIQAGYTKFTPTHYAYLKISEGCNNHCSYCTIPKIRGGLASKPLEDILAEAKFQVSLGVKELILVAEDTTAWGQDIYGKPRLTFLLEELAKLPVFWIRLMYAYPSRLTDDLIQIIKSKPNIVNYLDLPIQHVSSKILKAMNRQYDKDFLEGLIRDLKKEMPDIALRTTLITGFPGEGETEFKEIYDFIEEYPFAHLGCFAYSDEKDTKSYHMGLKNDLEVSQKRAEQIMGKQLEIVKNENKKLIGKKLSLLYEGNNQGRTYRKAPDIDSLVLIENVKGLKTGEFYEVEITGFEDYDLVGIVN